MFFRLILVLLAGASSLSQISPPAGTSVATASDMQVLTAASARLIRGYAGSALQWIRRQAGVQTASLGPDGRTIELSFRDGLQTAILPPFKQITSHRLAPTYGTLRTHVAV